MIITVEMIEYEFIIIIIWTATRATVTVVIRVNTIINFKMKDPLAAQ